MTLIQGMKHLTVSRNRKTRIDLLKQWNKMKYYSNNQLKVLMAHINRLQER